MEMFIKNIIRQLSFYILIFFFVFNSCTNVLIAAPIINKEAVLCDTLEPPKCFPDGIEITSENKERIIDGKYYLRNFYYDNIWPVTEQFSEYGWFYYYQTWVDETYGKNVRQRTVDVTNYFLQGLFQGVIVYGLIEWGLEFENNAGNEKAETTGRVVGQLTSIYLTAIIFIKIIQQLVKISRKKILFEKTEKIM